MSIASAEANIRADASNRRVEPRIRTMRQARLRDARSERDVCIVDISTRGLMATAAQPPRRGEVVEFEIGKHRVKGEVRWVSGQRFGVALRDRVSVAAAMEGGDGPIGLAQASAKARRAKSSAAGSEASALMIGKLVHNGMYILAGISAAFLLTEVASHGLDSIQTAVLALGGRP